MLWLKIEGKLKEKGISVYRLSKLAGVSHQALSSLKTGKSKSPSFELMVKIADALDISLDEFRLTKKALWKALNKNYLYLDYTTE